MSVASTLIPASVNSLPSEILSHIFYLVLATKPKNCIQKEIDPEAGHCRAAYVPKYPDVLLLISHRWHHIAIGTHALWTHIDLVPHRCYGASVLTRAKAFLTRAASSLLDIHIICPQASGFCQSNAEIAGFLDSVATHIRSLSLFLRSAGAEGFCLMVVQTCFAKCVSGSFKQLHLTKETSSPLFIDITAEDAHHPDLPVALAQPQSTSMTSLSLRGIYPHWGSKAYHGLVELNLLPGDCSTSITMSQLISVLIPSPGLQILRFGLRTRDATWEFDPARCVHLHELEVLDLRGMRAEETKFLLHLLAPGLKPLQLSLKPPSALSWSTNPCRDAFTKFFDCSNVTRLHLVGWRDHESRLLELLHLAPQLQYLALEGFLPRTLSISLSYPDEPGASATQIPLEHFYLLRCKLDSDALRALQLLIQRHQVQALTLWRCDYRWSSGEESISAKEKHRNRVTKIYPAARFLRDKKRSPLKDWYLPP